MKRSGTKPIMLRIFFMLISLDKNLLILNDYSSTILIFVNIEQTLNYINYEIQKPLF